MRVDMAAYGIDGTLVDDRKTRMIAMRLPDHFTSVTGLSSLQPL